MIDFMDNNRVTFQGSLETIPVLGITVDTERLNFSKQGSAARIETNSCMICLLNSVIGSQTHEVVDEHVLYFRGSQILGDLAIQRHKLKEIWLSFLFVDLNALAQVGTTSLSPLTTGTDLMMETCKLLVFWSQERVLIEHSSPNVRFVAPMEMPLKTVNKVEKNNCTQSLLQRLVEPIEV